MGPAESLRELKAGESPEGASWCVAAACGWVGSGGAVARGDGHAAGSDAPSELPARSPGEPPPPPPYESEGGGGIK